jgi:2-polyprenyl-6-methoxyphenol hydroxylase-like FAD-dependent oxidoreductase
MNPARERQRPLRERLAPCLLAMTGQGSWSQRYRRYVMRNRDPVENWSDAPVTLLGDAAHPTVQYIAQGAAVALEDAICLADEVDRHDDDMTAAFKAHPRFAPAMMQTRSGGESALRPAMRSRIAKAWPEPVNGLSRSVTARSSAVGNGTVPRRATSVLDISRWI